MKALSFFFFHNYFQPTSPLSYAHHTETQSDEYITIIPGIVNTADTFNMYLPHFFKNPRGRAGWPKGCFLNCKETDLVNMHATRNVKVSTENKFLYLCRRFCNYNLSLSLSLSLSLFARVL